MFWQLDRRRSCERTDIEPLALRRRLPRFRLFGNQPENPYRQAFDDEDGERNRRREQNCDVCQPQQKIDHFHENYAGEVLKILADGGS